MTPTLTPAPPVSVASGGDQERVEIVCQQPRLEDRVEISIQKRGTGLGRRPGEGGRLDLGLGVGVELGLA